MLLQLSTDSFYYNAEILVHVVAKTCVELKEAEEFAGFFQGQTFSTKTALKAVKS